MTKWRTGRKNPLVLYEQLGDEPSDVDPMIGSMFSAEFAALVVEAVNGAEPKDQAECRSKGDHCEHYYAWPPAVDEETGEPGEPSGDPGDGLGVEGACCECGKVQESTNAD